MNETAALALAKQVDAARRAEARIVMLEEEMYRMRRRIGWLDGIADSAADLLRAIEQMEGVDERAQELTDQCRAAFQAGMISRETAVQAGCRCV